MKRIILTVWVVFLFCSVSEGYDNKKAHRDFNVAISNSFKSKAASFPEFKNYNFGLDLVKITGPAVTASGYKYVTTSDVNLTIKEWIKEGGYSADEPEIPAAYRHFYDPISIDGKSHLTDINIALAQFNPEVDAIYWHFQGDNLSQGNEWSWNKAKYYMGMAISEGDEKVRNNYLARAFRSLGEVLHNTADMGCPPHVRNDAHGGFGLGGSDPYEGGFDAAWIALYEKNSCDPSLKTQLATAPTAMDANKYLSSFTNKYFFSDETISGTGVQQYSSRNGKKDYPFPKLDKLIYEDETFNYIQNFQAGVRFRCVTISQSCWDFSRRIIVLIHV